MSALVRIWRQTSIENAAPAENIGVTLGVKGRDAPPIFYLPQNIFLVAELKTSKF
jgi:hypothetical protein